MKLLFVLATLTLQAETRSSVVYNAPLPASSGNLSAGGTQVYIYDTVSPPEWYGVSLQYVDLTGAKQSLWFVCTADPKTPVQGGGYTTLCYIAGLALRSGEAVVLRPDGK